MWLIPLLFAFQPGASAIPPVPAGDSPKGEVMLQREFQESPLLREILNPRIDNGVDWLEMNRFYSRRGFQPVWHRERQLTEEGQQLLLKILDAASEGLNPEDYHAPALLLWAGIGRSDETALPEVLLTDALFRYSRDLRNGRIDPGSVDREWYIDPDGFNPVDLLQQALDGNRLPEMIAGLTPEHPGYLGLRRALEKYRRIQAEGGWGRIPDGPLIRQGDRHPQVEGLRTRLAVEGDYPGGISDDPLLADAGIMAALTGFQRRHGLKADGVLGRESRAALNVPVAERIEQIRANMERWRWLPNELGERYLLVDTGGFVMQLVEDGEIRISQKTISGRFDRPTPSFSSRITHLVTNPAWTVPRRIAVKDLLPLQRRDPGYFKEKEIRVYRQDGTELQEEDPSIIDWSLYHWNNFPFVLRQTPGDHNSLGRFKFQLSNPFNIYLHDTPARELFAKESRALSSGCVRLEDARRLADFVYQDLAAQASAPLDGILETGATHWQRLDRSIPVYIAYFTSWTGEDGNVHFQPDIYQRDPALIQALRYVPPGKLRYYVMLSRGRDGRDTGGDAVR
jgi:murein L,D-transpeptidase YcbB/YkuD